MIVLPSLWLLLSISCPVIISSRNNNDQPRAEVTDCLLDLGPTLSDCRNSIWLVSHKADWISLVRCTALKLTAIHATHRSPLLLIKIGYEFSRQ